MQLSFQQKTAEITVVSINSLLRRSKVVKCFRQVTRLIVYISVSPLIVKGPNNISVTEGTDAEFYCLAKGNPVPLLIWETLIVEWDSMSVDSLNSFHYQNKFTIESHFKIRRAARQFSGWFRCRTAVEQPHSSDHDYDEVIVHSGPAYLEILCNNFDVKRTFLVN